jgi:hypothetical protein
LQKCLKRKWKVGKQPTKKKSSAFGQKQGKIDSSPLCKKNYK